MMLYFLAILLGLREDEEEGMKDAQSTYCILLNSTVGCKLNNARWLGG